MPPPSKTLPAQLRAILQFDAYTALIPLPGMALLLFGGVQLHEQIAAGIAAGAAYSVGFGVTKKFWRSRSYAVVLTGTGMTAVAFIGTLVGNDPIVELAATAILGACCGALSRRNADHWWACLQIIIAFLLAASFPGTVTDGALRAAIVAGGAALQCVSVMAMIHLIGEPRPTIPGPANLSSTVEVRFHALRAAICISVALLASRTAGFAHSYWAPMTAMLVLKPGLRDTAGQGLERIAGTIAGIIVASGLTRIAPSDAWTATFAILTAGVSFGLQQARYAVFSAAITTSVLLMIALAGGALPGADRERLLATLLGGAIALAGAAIAPRRRTNKNSGGGHL